MPTFKVYRGGSDRPEREVRGADAAGMHAEDPDARACQFDAQRVREGTHGGLGGDILDGVTVQEKGQEIFELILRVASGEQSKSEQLGYGDNEFVPWQIGATM